MNCWRSRRSAPEDSEAAAFTVQFAGAHPKMTSDYEKPDLPISPNGKGSRKESVWYITGTSSGFGRRLVNVLLERGDKVIATARSLSKIEDFPKSDNLRLQQLDITDGPEVLSKKFEEAVTWFGRIDVLVNNAGVAVKALIEEGGSVQLRKQYDVNLFGTLDVTTAVLPHMRARRSGTIVLIGSRVSWQPGNPSSGPYASSKAAVRVMGETLAVELAPFSIRVLIVEPGAFRTENIFSQPFYEDNPIPDYDELRKVAIAHYKAVDGMQPGDPLKAMQALVDVIHGEGRAKGKAWPLFLPLGVETETAIRDKFETLDGLIDEWDELIRDTRLDNLWYVNL